MKIEQLLEKYFEGETSTDEEKTLHEYFLSADVLPEHMQYTALFKHFEVEKEVVVSNPDFDKNIISQINTLQKKKTNLKLIYTITSVAASVLIFIGSYYYFTLNQNKVSDKIITQKETKAIIKDTTIAQNNPAITEEPIINIQFKQIRHRIAKTKSRQDNLVLKQFKNAMLIVARNLEKVDRNKTAINIIDSSMNRIQKILKTEQDKLLLIPKSGD